MAHIAQEILVEYIKKNEEKLYRIAYTYTKNQENALDVVQEAITKSLENISKLRNEEYVKTWFYRILINEAIKASKNTKSFIDYETITNELSSQSNENELIEIAEEIGDKIIFKGYEEKQVIALVNTLLGLDFLSMKYSTREEILSVLCDATANYDISKKINWNNISKIANKVEDDLKEYIKEFLHN